jgi:ABC-type uncharacterized transport system substrate-binding protein
MRKSGVLSILVALAVLAVGVIADAQQPKKVPRVGYLSSADPASESARSEPFRLALRELGYIDGQHISTEYRYSEGKNDRLPELAAELVRLKVDVIVTGGVPLVRAAMNATKTIPIVMLGQGSDPVEAGLIDSLARPGGNVTGLTLLSPELSGKRLELLKETMPKISRVAVLFNPSNPAAILYLNEVEVAAKSFGLQLQTLKASRPTDLASALSGAVIGRAHALITLPDAMFFSSRVQVTNFAAQNRVPAMFPESEFVNEGGLMSYGPNLPDLFRRAATYVDKILKGAKAADLPVEQPTKFEFVINLKTAKQIGLTIPPNVLARADKVIK